MSEKRIDLPTIKNVDVSFSKEESLELASEQSFNKTVYSGDVYTNKGRFGGSENYWTIGENDLYATYATAGNLYFRAGKENFADTANGWILGIDAGVPKFLLGGATDSILMSAGNITITGTISATAGSIGGWTINTSSLTDTAGTVGMSSAVTGGDDIRFWAGDATPASAEFRVYESGALVASSATITGAITATSGAIGSFTIGTYLYTGTKTAWNDANAGVHLGSDGIGIGNNIFTVNGSTGAMVASSADITGTVNATAGKFGTATNYWSIGATGLTATSASTDVIINYGKTDFDNTQVGFILGYDFSALLPKFYIGTTTAYLNFTGAAFNLRGTTIDYPTITNLQAGTEISIQGWQNTCIFSSTDYNTVAWATGTITLLDGTTYSITAGNTGNIAALTYIYLNIAVSLTVLQTTTTAATAVGTGKILIAVASPNADTTSKATFQAFGGSGGQLLTVDSIAANSASVNEFISNTAQIKDAIITDAKIGTLSANKIVAGTGIINALSVLSTLTMGSAITDGYIQSYGWDGTVAGFQLKGGATPAFTLIGGTITGGIFQTATSGARTVFNTSGIQGYDATTQRYNIANDGSGWLGASTTLAWTTAGVLTLGGFTASATTLTGGTTNIILDSSNKAISINNATFGQSGIQLQYNAGTPRAYIGDGANQSISFSGSSLIVKGGLTPLISYTAIENVSQYDAVCYLAQGTTIEVLETNATWTHDIEWGFNAPSRVKIAQSFTGVSGKVTRLKVLLKKTGTPTDNAVIEIRSVSQTGTVLATATKAGADITTSLVQYELALDSSVTLSSGIEYFVVFSRSGSLSNSNYFRTQANNTGVYASGIMSQDDGTSWSDFAGYDLEVLLQFYAYTDGIYLASATSTAFTEKFIGFAYETKTAGNAVLVQYMGILSGITTGVAAGGSVFLSNTFGDTSSTPGTVTLIVGKSVVMNTDMLIKGV
jgi:hypothetical protein